MNLLKTENVNLLWVCWERPRFLPNSNITILSFLDPIQETMLKEQFQGSFISARKLAQSIKEEAVGIYTALIADIGATPVKQGKSLRQALVNKDNLSLWWFQKVSTKDCENEQTFNFIIQVLTIASCAEKTNSKNIVFWGGFAEIAEALESRFTIKKIRCKRKYGLKYKFLNGIISRISYFSVSLFKWFMLKLFVKEHRSFSIDVVFSGFWDWSAKEDKTRHILFDRYYNYLPEKLTSLGFKIGWFLWFDPFYKNKISLNFINKLISIKRYNDAIILQSFLKLADFIRVILNFRPFFILLGFYRSKNFKDLFIKDRINYFSILHAPLSYGCLNCVIPNCELVFLAVKRASKKYQPKITLNFLEFFLYSRAFYSGARQGNKSAVHFAVQHASYTREKTFLLLNKEKEHLGKPDGLPVPNPDYIFSMGELARDILLERGFSEQSVFLTGSSRYDYIKNDPIRANRRNDVTKHVLLVTSINCYLEMDMVKAVYEASKSLPQLKLYLRSHPFAKMADYPSFKQYRDKIQISSGTLDEDLQNADLIIFSSSTLAEEALLKGIPVWQWVSFLYNGSVFRDLKVVPEFSTVLDLREAFKKFIIDSTWFIPGEEIKKIVLKECFYAADGLSHERIAETLSSRFLKNQPSLKLK